MIENSNNLMLKMESIVDRIYKIADCKGFNISEFSKIIGVSNGYLAKQKTNNANVGSHIIEKIVREFPDINSTWLLTGNGEMVLAISKDDAFEKNSKKYLEDNLTQEELLARSITWLVCSSYSKRKNSDFTFNSLGELAEVFRGVSTLLDVLQNTLEADVTSEVVAYLGNNPKVDDEGGFVIDASVESVLDKYISIYTELKDVSIDAMTIIHKEEALKLMSEVLKKKQ